MYDSELIYLLIVLYIWNYEIMDQEFAHEMIVGLMIKFQ